MIVFNVQCPIQFLPSKGMRKLERGGAVNKNKASPGTY